MSEIPVSRFVSTEDPEVPHVTKTLAAEIGIKGVASGGLGSQRPVLLRSMQDSKAWLD